MRSGSRNASGRRDQRQLNHRQLELLLYALRHPQTEFSTLSHQRAQGIDYQIARADLLQLEQLGYLTKRRLGRAFVFVPVDDLDQRMAGLA